MRRGAEAIGYPGTEVTDGCKPCVLVTKLQSSARAARALHGAIALCLKIAEWKHESTDMNPLTCPLALKMCLRHLEHYKIPVWSPSLQSLLFPQNLWAQASSYHSGGKHPARIPSSTVDWTLPRSANLSHSSCEHGAWRRAGSLWAFGQFQWTKTLEDGNSLCYKWAILAPFPIWNQSGGDAFHSHQFSYEPFLNHQLCLCVLWTLLTPGVFWPSASTLPHTVTHSFVKCLDPCFRSFFFFFFFSNLHGVFPFTNYVSLWASLL